MKANSYRARLVLKLHEQLRFLQRSCAAFDAGEEAEALRIATTLRILFWDKGQSTSILTHLNLRDGQMLSSSRGHGDYKDYLQIILNFASSTPVRAQPMLGQKFLRVSVSDWWCHESVFLYEGNRYSRQTVVLSAAHKDGGAHVDKKLEHYYLALSSGRFSIGLTGDFKYEGAPPFEQGVTQYAPNAHLCLLRQFAHETLASAKLFKWGSSG